MLTKRINVIVVVASQVLNFSCLVITAYIAAKLVWWMINPAINEVYVEKTNPSTYEKSPKYIINRYPFGIVVVAKAEESVVVIPKIASQLKVSGIYQNTATHSAAIVDYAGKTNVYGVGSLIADSALVIAIESNGITVSEEGKETFVAISHGDGNAATPISTSSRPGIPATPSAMATPQSNTDVQADSQRLSGDEIREKRRKMIEEFTRQQNGGADTGASAASNNSTSDNAVNASAENTAPAGQVETVKTADENNGSNADNAN